MKKFFALLLCLCFVLSAAAMAEGDKPFAGETVTILTRYATYPAWNTMVEQVEDMTGITINTVTASSEYSDYVTKASSALAINDDSYDILDVDELLGVSFEAAGYLEPINEVIDSCKDKYLSTWLESISNPGDGNYYLLPSSYSGVFLYVNKAMFEEAGIAYPTTEEELIEAAQKLTDVDNGVYGLGSAWMQGGYMFNDIQRLIMAYDGDFYDWDNEGTQKAVQFMYDQVNTWNITPVAAISEDYSAENQKFYDGKYAMIFQWQSGYTTCQDKWDEYEIIAIPSFVKPATIMSSWGFGVNVNSKHKDAAKEVLKAMATMDVQMNALNIEYTQHSDVLASEEAAVDPVLVALSEYGQANCIAPREMPTYVNEIQSIIETNVSAYVSGQMSLEECCANVNFGFEDLQ